MWKMVDEVKLDTVDVKKMPPSSQYDWLSSLVGRVSVLEQRRNQALTKGSDQRVKHSCRAQI